MSVRGKKVVMLIEDEHEDYEVWIPLRRLVQQGAQVTLVAPEPGRYVSRHGNGINAELAAREVDPARLHALVIPGGNPRGRLRAHGSMVQLVRAAGLAGKTLAASSDGVWVLASAGLLRGRAATGLLRNREDVRRGGGVWVDREVVRDANLITSRSLPALCRELEAALRGVLPAPAQRLSRPFRHPGQLLGGRRSA